MLSLQQFRGWPVSRIDLLMMTLIVLVTIIGLQTVGMLMIVALLIIPPTAARFWTECLSRMVLLGGGFGAASGYCGAAASALLPRMPAGAVIVLVAGAIFLLSFLFAPRRGLIAAAVRRVQLSIRIAIDHFLRDAYEQLEIKNKMNEDGVVMSFSDLRFVDTWGRLTKKFYRRLLTFRGLIQPHDNVFFVLTRKGKEKAARLTRNHRLWEAYIQSAGHIATSHVDYSADLVEHVLSVDIVENLEKALDKTGRLPEIKSIHPL